MSEKYTEIEIRESFVRGMRQFAVDVETGKYEVKKVTWSKDYHPITDGKEEAFIPTGKCRLVVEFETTDVG